MIYSLDSIHSWRTYAGVLEGVPDAHDVINYAIDRVRDRYELSAPIYTISPPLKEIPIKHPYMKSVKMLPEWAHAATFFGPPHNKEADWASVCVIWFDDDPLGTQANTIVTDEMWKKNAKDWWF